VEEKQRSCHAGGVYSPALRGRFDHPPCDRAKGPGQDTSQVLDVKILDPACGSGSFLVAACQHLFDYCWTPSAPTRRWQGHVQRCRRSGPKAEEEIRIAFQEKDGRWYLAPDFRALF